MQAHACTPKLTDGTQQSVLVPQVYVRVKPGDVDGTGALLAGQDVKLNLSGDMNNSGTIAGRKLVQINANNIQNLGGQMSADTLVLQALQDINNIGGTMTAASAAIATAGRDIHLTTTTQSRVNQVGASSFAQTGIDRVAGLYVTGPAGVLLASAGRDIHLTAAHISNTGTGATALQAGNNLNLNTVTTGSSQRIVWDANNRLSQSQSQDVGTSIQGGGNLNLKAGQDLSAKAASVSAAGALGVSAGKNIDITAGQASQSFDEARQLTHKGTLASKTTTTRVSNQSTTAQGSSFEGNSLSMNAGKDLTVQGSSVLADKNVTLSAGANVKIEAAQNTSTSSNFSQTTKSGLMSSGLSVTLGKQQQSLDQGQTQTTAAASTVGSLGGNVSISAGQSYTQTGSDVMTPGLKGPSGSGNIDITAKSVTINEARETGSQSSEQKFKQSGVTLAVTSPVISTLQSVQQQAQAAGNTGSSRMQALAAANAAMQVKQGAGQVQEAVSKGDASAGAGISVSVGSSSSQAKQQSSADTARGSSLTAGGNVRIAAVGAGKDSDLSIQGSDIKAAGAVALKADDQVRIVAAHNTTQESSSQTSKSGSIGVAISTQGTGVTASASKATGQGAGTGATYTNTQVAGNTVSITSGSDTTLQGAVVKGEQVTANVGGNLNIESLQDSNQYKESSKSAGGSVTIGPAPGGSLNVAASKIKSDFQSTGEQSAIRAGDGGFAVNVQGNTALTGGQITSTQAAIDNNKNTFTTGGTLSTTDLQNQANFEAKSVSIGVGTTAGKVSPSGVGIGSDKGSASSITTAGISGIAGNTAARTGDKETGVGQIFNKEQVRQEVAAQVAITSEFGKQASKAVGDYAGAKLKEAEKNNDQAGIEAWKEGGANRVALHAVVGGLTGGASGAAGAAAASAAAPGIELLQGQLQTILKSAGLGDDASKVIASLAGGATAATIGAAAGGTTAGAATAFNADMNNRQLHPTEKQRIKELAKGDAQKEARLTAAACALVSCYAEYPEGSVSYNTLKAMADVGSGDAMIAERLQLQAQQGLFGYSTQGVFSDKNIDAAKQVNNTYQVTTRALGAGQAVLGGLGVAGSVATAPVSCATGVGCLANATVGTVSADAVLSGAKQLVSGQPENTALNNALQALGLSPEAAGYAEAALGIGAAAKVGSVVNAVTASKAGNNAVAKLSYEDISKFGAKGLNVTPEVMQTPQAKALIAEYQAAGVNFSDAVDYAAGVLQTGRALPTVRTVAANEELIKVVPKSTMANDGVGARSPYFMTRSEYDSLSKLSPAEIGQRLGLPAEQSVRGAQLGFEAYSITPKPGTAPKVFTSTVAPVEQGAYSSAGGAQQTVVPNRLQWSEPKSMGSFGGAK